MCLHNVLMRSSCLLKHGFCPLQLQEGSIAHKCGLLTVYIKAGSQTATGNLCVVLAHLGKLAAPAGAPVVLACWRGSGAGWDKREGRGRKGKAGGQGQEGGCSAVRFLPQFPNLNLPNRAHSDLCLHSSWQRSKQTHRGRGDSPHGKAANVPLTREGPQDLKLRCETQHITLWDGCVGARGLRQEWRLGGTREASLGFAPPIERTTCITPAMDVFWYQTMQSKSINTIHTAELQRHP